MLTIPASGIGGPWGSSRRLVAKLHPELLPTSRDQGILHAAKALDYSCKGAWLGCGGQLQKHKTDFSEIYWVNGMSLVVQLVIWSRPSRKSPPWKFWIGHTHCLPGSYSGPACAVDSQGFCTHCWKCNEPDDSLTLKTSRCGESGLGILCQDLIPNPGSTRACLGLIRFCVPHLQCSTHLEKRTVRNGSCYSGTCRYQIHYNPSKCLALPHISLHIQQNTISTYLNNNTVHLETSLQQ